MAEKQITPDSAAGQGGWGGFDRRDKKVGECNVRGSDTIMGCYVAPLPPGGKSRRLDFATNSQATSRAATKPKPNLPKATNSQGQSWKNWELGPKPS